MKEQIRSSINTGEQLRRRVPILLLRAGDFSPEREREREREKEKNPRSLGEKKMFLIKEHAASDEACLER